MRASYIPLFIALFAGLLLLFGGPGSRLGLWEFRFGFDMMRWAAILGLGAAALSLLLLMSPKARRRRLLTLLTALALGLAVAWLPWSFLQKARSVPAIHDITTDTADPPKFVVIRSIRADAPNPPGYAGTDTALKQKEAYPDIRPLLLDTKPGAAFKMALDAARGMGWEIVAAVPEAGRIEATARTFWYGFKDDVVIRVREEDGGSSIDVRSKSRVGRGDVGANAERIREFMGKLRE